MYPLACPTAASRLRAHLPAPMPVATMQTTAGEDERKELELGKKDNKALISHERTSWTEWLECLPASLPLYRKCSALLQYTNIPPLPPFRCHCFDPLVFFVPNNEVLSSSCKRWNSYPLDPLILSTSLISHPLSMHTNDPLHLRMLDDHMKFMVWDDYVVGKRLRRFMF
jgi:hypothetical protein